VDGVLSPSPTRAAFLLVACRGAHHAPHPTTTCQHTTRFTTTAVCLSCLHALPTPPVCCHIPSWHCSGVRIHHAALPHTYPISACARAPHHAHGLPRIAAPHISLHAPSPGLACAAAYLLRAPLPHHTAALCLHTACRSTPAHTAFRAARYSPVPHALSAITLLSDNTERRLTPLWLCDDVTRTRSYTAP